MSTDTREALAALMVIAAECAQRKPLRGFEELTEATHIGHRQFGRAHEQADEAVRMLAVRLRAVFDTLAAALAAQAAQPTCPYEETVFRKFGETMSFGRPHIVHLRILKEEGAKT